MTKQFEGKVALVTGAASGIGRASALAFAREGAKTVVADVLVEGGEETVRIIKEAGGDALLVRSITTPVLRGRTLQRLTAPRKTGITRSPSTSRVSGSA